MQEPGNNWKLVKTALQSYGERAIAGARSNPLISRALRLVGLGPRDETAWCSAWLNQVAMEAGCERSGSAAARSWLQVGMIANLADAQPGDIVILWRGSPTSWQGHVGIFIRAERDRIWILGGNQNNQVSIAVYPTSRLLGVRRLRPATA